jgi:hypothetical protein
MRATSSSPFLGAGVIMEAQEGAGSTRAHRINESRNTGPPE